MIEIIVLTIAIPIEIYLAWFACRAARSAEMAAEVAAAQAALAIEMLSFSRSSVRAENLEAFSRSIESRYS